ncbi:MAG: lytic transglycosylase domain-containing protein [Magnetococcus sp. DMHC-6]
MAPELFNRSKWPKDDFLASYLELELLLRAKKNTTVEELLHFLERWPKHAQAEQVRQAIDKKIIFHENDLESLAWYEQRAPKTYMARSHFIKILVNLNQVLRARPLWMALYRDGVTLDLPTPAYSLFMNDITPADQEARAIAFLKSNKSDLFQKQLDLLPIHRRPYLKALASAMAVDKKTFNTLLPTLSPEDAKSPQLWAERLNGLYKKGLYQEAKAILSSPEGAYATPEILHRVRYYIGRDDLFFKQNLKSAYELFQANALEAGSKLPDSLWLFAWSAYQLNNKQIALEYLLDQAVEAKSDLHRSQAAYWAAHLIQSGANPEMGEQERRAWLTYAARFPAAFYGLLAEEELTGKLTPPPAAELSCPQEDQPPELKQRVQQMESLRTVGRDTYIPAEIDQVAKDLGLSTQRRICLADYFGAIYPLIRLGEQYRLEPQGQTNLHALYPIPKKWQPLTGWRLTPDLIWGMARQESLFITHNKSSVGAKGLLQLMPATAKGEAERLNLPPATPTRLEQPNYNLTLGQSYLEQMLMRYDGDLVLATIAYNAGPGRADKWRPKREEQSTIDFLEGIPITETRNYVQRVIHGHIIYSLQMNGQASILADLAKGRPDGIKRYVTTNWSPNSPPKVTIPFSEPIEVTPKKIISTPKITITKPIKNTTTGENSLSKVKPKKRPH